MTVQTQVKKVTANGNDSGTTFSFSPLVIFSSADIEVTITDSAGVETNPTLGTGPSNYSVSVSSFPGTGSVVYPADEVTPLATGSTITMRRVLTLEQTLDLENQGGYFPDLQETAFDKLVMQNLQQQEELDRSIKVPVSYTGSADFTLPTPSALKLFRWDSTGLLLESITAADLGAVVLSNADPESVSLTANYEGVATDVSRRDHTHLLPTVPVTKGGTGAVTAGAALTNLGLSANGSSLVTAADYAAMRTLLDLEAGTDFVAYDALLQSIANLGSQAAGDLLYLSALDTVARLGVGTNGEVLTLASGLPSWVAASGGAWVEIAEGTASAVASVDLTFTAASWRAVRLIVTNLIPATDDTEMYVRLSDDSGVSYEAGSIYSYAVQRVVGGVSPAASNLGANDTTQLRINTAGNGTNEHGSFDLVLYDPNAAGNIFDLMWQSISTISAGNYITAQGAGAMEHSTSPINGIQFLQSAGNITSCKYKLLGLTE